MATLPNPVKAVIFDMDGLLIDSEALYCRSMLSAAAECGHDMREDAYHALCGRTWADISDALVETYGADFPVEPFKVSWLKHHRLLSQEMVALKPGVTEILDLLDRLRLPRAVATSSGHETVARHLGAFNLIERFDHIVARGDYAMPKPSPQPYLLAASRLGIEPRHCLALEDSHTGVRSASAAGAMTVMVPDIMSATGEMRKACVHIAADLFAVGDMLLGATLVGGEARTVD